MQDRVPLYPGRVTLTPVSGQANTFDLTRADQPTQEGTPLNKASLLKDATAALFGKTNAAVPDDILSLLSKSTLAQTAGKYTRHVGTNADRLVGSTMTLNVDGKPYEFIVVQQGKPSSMYDDSCSGTWLLMKDIYEKRQWHSSDVNKYETSDVDTWLNNDFVGLFDDSVQQLIKQVKIPYRQNGGTNGTDRSGANGLSRKAFLLGGYEVGFTTSDNLYLPVDGAKLAYFESGTGTSANNKRIAKLSGSAVEWCLRSPYTYDTRYAWFVTSDGGCSYNITSSSRGVLPCIIFSSDAEYIYYTDSSGNVYSEQEYETMLTDVLGNLIAIPAGQIKDGVKIETGSYTGTGTYGASNPNSLTFGFVPSYILVFAEYMDTTTRCLYWMQIFWDISLVPVFNTYENANGNLSNYFPCTGSFSGTNVSWHSAKLADQQMNRASVVYHYIAIG